MTEVLVAKLLIFKWWPETGSNRRRRPFQGRALPLSYLANSRMGARWVDLHSSVGCRFTFRSRSGAEPDMFWGESASETTASVYHRLGTLQPASRAHQRNVTCWRT